MAVRELEKIRIGTENRGLREGQSRDMPKTEIRKTKGMRTFRNLVGRQRIQGKSSGKKRGERGAEKSPEPLRDKRWGQRRLLNLGNHPNPFGQCAHVSGRIQTSVWKDLVGEDAGETHTLNKGENTTSVDVMIFQEQSMQRHLSAP